MKGTKYVAAALRNACERIERSPDGARAITTYAEAFNLGRLAPVLNLEKAESALILAALAAGLSDTEARQQVRSGLRRGAEDPHKDLQHGQSPPRPPATASLTYPPRAEVRRLWRRSAPVTDNEEVAAYLAERCLDPVVVELYDLARALPSDGVPAWATRGGRSWAASGHRLVLPLYDHEGRLRSLRGRAVCASELKSLTPAGYALRGLVLACPLMRQLLRPEGAPSWWPSQLHDALGAGGVIVAEGGPDFLTWATLQREESEYGAAIVGVFSGSWTQALADRIPDGADVVLRVHADAGGDKLARIIGITLRGRVQLYRLGGTVDA